MSFQEKYLKDMVYGSIDGIITTFAVVSGVIGASLSFGIIVVLGLANLLADGFSMAVGNYLSTRSELEKIEKRRKEFHDKIKKSPASKVDELKKVLREMGFSQGKAEHLSEDIMPDKKAWESLMVSEEYGRYERTEPQKTALATFVAFIVAGAVPLLAFIFAMLVPSFEEYAVSTSIVLTGASLFLVGALKALVVKNESKLKSGLKTLAIGGFAAFVAFLVGFLLKNLVS